MYVKIKIEQSQKYLDLIATIMIDLDYSYSSATTLVGTYYILKEDNMKIPKELSELIETSIDYNKKNLYGLLKLIQVSPSFTIGLTFKKLIYKIFLPGDKCYIFANAKVDAS